MQEKLRVAVVGCGIGEEHLTDGFSLARDVFDVVALCDLDAQRLASVAERHGIDRTTTRFEDLLAMPDVDVIDICTPPTVHFDQIKAVLAAGKHVICEKPLVGSLREIDEIIEIEKASAGALMPIFQYRFGQGVQQAKRIIDADLAGRPFFVSAETFWSRDQAYYANPWRGRWASELGGVLMTQAIHIHDLVTYLMGPVDRLFGRIATRVNQIEVDDCATASLQFKNGALGSFSATLGSSDQISRIRLMFENVTIESDHNAYRPGRQPWRFLPKTAEIESAIASELEGVTATPAGFEAQFRGFFDHVVKGRPLPVTLRDSRQSLEIASAFYHSAFDCTDIVLPIERGHAVYDGWTQQWTDRKQAV
ncbi:oxidoreductase [Devosia pacifica]|uniref:Oxidoreductase n=1 Tax=Devosia pacifica TaxID=1335967 RepID=A0A918SD82_9HYPH|nr:Gfo/Idh/MocA family oxidoreductase [Devosia pacifica]GHA35834.1 oxidoreductase [Devosia pacifica]